MQNLSVTSAFRGGVVIKNTKTVDSVPRGRVRGTGEEKGNITIGADAGTNIGNITVTNRPGAVRSVVRGRASSGTSASVNGRPVPGCIAGTNKCSCSKIKERQGGENIKNEHTNILIHNAGQRLKFSSLIPPKNIHHKTCILY